MIPRQTILNTQKLISFQLNNVNYLIINNYKFISKNFKRLSSSCSTTQIAYPYVEGQLTKFQNHDISKQDGSPSSNVKEQKSPPSFQNQQTFLPKTIKQILTNSLQNDTSVKEAEHITVSGWVRSTRTHKNHTFIELCDGTFMKPLQAIVDNSKLQNTNSLHTGTSLKLEGKLVSSPGQNQDKELVIEYLKIVGECHPDAYPLAKSRIPFEVLREYPHLRSRSKTFGCIWRLRNALVQQIHDFFQKNDFLLVQTPIFTSHDCEGAGEVFRVTTNDQQINFIKDESKEHFFSKPVYLTVSGQLHLESLASAHSRVYTLNPAFRAEKSSTSRHLAEFYMLEAELAFLESLPELMDVVEQLLKQVTMSLIKGNSHEFEFLNQWIDKSLLSRIDIFVSEPFGRITYSEAIEELSKVKNKKWTYPVKWGNALQSEHEKYLAEVIFKRPVFVTDYPQSIKPFYMKLNHSDFHHENEICEGRERKTVACLDLLIPKVGELVGGSLRENSYENIKSVMISQELCTKDYQWYLDLRRFGSTPHGGFGLGLERYLQYLTGMSTVKDLIYMPRTFENCDM